MRSREELLRELASNPAEVVEYAFQLQEQLTEARAYIAELKRQLFGPKAAKLTPQQEEQLRQLTGDVQEQAQRPPPLSQQVLEPQTAPLDKEKPKRRRRHLLPPVQLEVRRDVLQPAGKHCEHCHQE